MCAQQPQLAKMNLFVIIQMYAKIPVIYDGYFLKFNIFKSLTYRTYANNFNIVRCYI
ncbi:hypothetical protein EDD70_1371 [Hydrogenoanaerobacterium saccharovorans]|uniref:Uncharacterized protein n=1 Tax=Hydrogenoanaerobacterium saccharovorans TaxID=474960 RepID=A0A1H7ZK21_9FIRM|nr:hypothetical protein EDD70_1371 [Hydrogenoanaerobacterium saccharovorans]SEM58675.1 hypothetical protein SAMN05216180_0719 [Hydrogenoanaerobacterium saccharovorans]